MINVLIVEDHPVVIEGLKKILTEKKFSTSIITAFSVSDCHKAINSFVPDLVLLDYSLPDGNGLDLCKTIVTKHPKTKILAISSFREQSLVKRMIENGASGFVLKNAAENEIIEAIQNVLAGKQYFGEEVLDILEGKDNNPILTRRELEVLKLIADGLTNPEIAEKLFISPLTVDSHRKNLIVKLHAKNTASLIKIAVQEGYV